MCLLALWTIVILGRFLGGAGVGVRGNTAVAGDCFLEPGGNPRNVVLAGGGGVTIPPWPWPSLLETFELGLLNPFVHELDIIKPGVLGARSSRVTGGGAKALAVRDGVV